MEAVYPPARFTVEVFFVCMFLLMCVSALAFSLLHFAPFAQQEKLENSSYSFDNEASLPSKQAGHVTYTNDAYMKDTPHSKNGLEASNGTDESFERKTVGSHAMKSTVASASVQQRNAGVSTALRSDKPAPNYLSTSDSSDDTHQYETVTSQVEVTIEEHSGSMSVGEYALLLAFLTIVNGMTNGVLPSTLTYSTLPYSNAIYDVLM